jgi:hypothetical protein
VAKFAELKQIGEKVLKFNQSKALNSDEAIWAVGLDSQRFQRAQKGVCAALTLDYIEDILANASFTPMIGPLITMTKDETTRFAPSKLSWNPSLAGFASGMRGLNPQFSNPRNVLAANAIVNQEKIGAEWGANGITVALEKAATGRNLKYETPEPLGSKFLDGFTSKLLIDQSKVAGFVCYDITFLTDTSGRTGAHAVAVWKDSTFVYFFDPNVGGYRVFHAKWNSFNAKYLEILRDQLKWGYLAGALCLMSRKDRFGF